MDNQKQNHSGLSNSQSENISSTVTANSSGLRQENGSDYQTEGIKGKASIENVVIDGGQINLQIKNLTTGNTLLSAYLEYVRLENGKESGSYPLDCDSLNISAGNMSDPIVFTPQKPPGKEGVIKIKKLVFRDGKDNYNVE